MIVPLALRQSIAFPLCRHHIDDCGSRQYKNAIGIPIQKLTRGWRFCHYRVMDNNNPTARDIESVAQIMAALGFTGDRSLNISIEDVDPRELALYSLKPETKA